MALEQDTALLIIFLWLRVAPFGDPVVPDVNCILIASSGRRPLEM
jgi:hypothetical protein